MLILLPPSEKKSSPGDGRPLDLAKLFGAEELIELRASMLSKDPEVNPALSRPAHEIYSGVLYQALDWQSLPTAAQSQGAASIRIVSALFGALSPTDAIPTYKAKIKSSLWSQALSSVFDSEDASLIVDCRSSTYEGVWTPPHEKTVKVRVFQVKDGKRSVITHMSKKYRGELTRYLLLQKAPNNPEELFTLARNYFDCELSKPNKKERWCLDLLIHI